MWEICVFGGRSPSAICGDRAALALSSHCRKSTALPPIHQDPFDRALIAQATAEEFILVTTDEDVSHYASERLRVIR